MPVVVAAAAARWPAGTNHLAAVVTGCVAAALGDRWLLDPQTLSVAGAGFEVGFISSKWWDFLSVLLFKQDELTRDIVPSMGFPASDDTLRLARDVGDVDRGPTQGGDLR